jgi:hypothetical protein
MNTLHKGDDRDDDDDDDNNNNKFKKFLQIHCGLQTIAELRSLQLGT